MIQRISKILDDSLPDVSHEVAVPKGGDRADEEGHKDRHDDEVEHAKPDPAIYLLAAKKLGVNPADCTVVEDAASGVKAAKTAGMQCIAVRNPNSGQQDLSLADIIINKYEEISI